MIFKITGPKKSNILEWEQSCLRSLMPSGLSNSTPKDSFSSYYFCNLFDNTGNVIFLFSEIVEGLGLLLGWILLQCFRDKDNIQGRIYMMGAMMVIITFPLIFLPPLSILPLIYGLTLVFKIGNGLMVISQLNAMSIVIKNSNQKVTLPNN